MIRRRSSKPPAKGIKVDIENNIESNIVLFKERENDERSECRFLMNEWLSRAKEDEAEEKHDALTIDSNSITQEPLKRFGKSEVEAVSLQEFLKALRIPVIIPIQASISFHTQISAPRWRHPRGQ